jgi:hypothetical protein
MTFVELVTELERIIKLGSSGDGDGYMLALGSAVGRYVEECVLAEREACAEEAIYEKRAAETRLAEQKPLAEAGQIQAAFWIAKARGQIQAAFRIAKHIRERGEK